MVAKWLAFKAIMGIVSLIPGIGPLIGAAGGIGAGGASALASGSDIPGFKTGGSFTVPSGFSNDKYPMLLSSGERATIETPHQAMMNDKSIGQVLNLLKILNVNITEGFLSQAIKKQGPISIYGEIDNNSIKLANDKASKVARRYGQ